jgi:putative hydrolase
MDAMADESFELPPDLLRQIPLFAELAKVLSWTGGPVNWDLARQIAVALAANEEGSHEVSRADAEELEESVRLGELWLQEMPGLPSPPRVAAVHALTPARWAERATSLREIVDPLAAKVASAMTEQSAEIAPESEAGMLGPVLQQMAPVFLGIQAGVALGSLASSVLGTYDLPFPLSEEGTIDVVLPAVDRFAEGYGLDRRETRLWVALHQSAHRISFEALPGVSAHFFALFHNYVSALQVDLSGAFDRLQSLDITSPDRLRDAMEQEGFFGLLDSPATQTALARVQKLLALLEAFADRAVDAAAIRLPTAPRIAEAMARRRADPAPGERMFGKFIGLEVPAEAVRVADAFCRGVLATAQWPALLRLWDDPENLPNDAELTEPAVWLARVAG